MLSLLLRRRDAGSQSALRLLDDASEALQYNRDLLQSALDQVRHGLSVFDKDMRLICWNRQFRELLNLPPELGQVGVPLDRILRACAERGDFGAGDIDKLVADRLMKLALAHETFQEQFDGGRRILEIRTSPMPQGGIVTTYSDITERVAAAEALARANETLERRVRERTAELTEVNEALAVAKRKADEANLDKTRFLAAASHDVLQPLNAARLYATSLVERTVGGQEATLARNIDASLEAVEEILGVLIEISRLDTGRLEPEITVFPLQEVFERLEVEFAAAGAREGARAAHRADAGVGPLGPAAAAPRAAEPRLQRHQVHRRRQGAARRAPARRPAGRAGLRHRSRHPQVEARAHLQGVPAAARRRRARCGASGSACRSSSASARCWATASDLQSVPGRGSTFSVELPQRRAAGVGGAAAASWRRRPDASPGSPCCASTTSPPCCAACRCCSRAGDASSSRRRNAAEAVARLGEAGARPDIILADYHLDDGTGVEAVAAVRAAAGSQAPGDRHHRRSFRGGAARGAPARLRACCASRSRRRRCARSCISSPGSAPWRRSSRTYVFLL